jgi:hypothetical protein
MDSARLYVRARRIGFGDEIRYSFRTRRISRLVDAAARSKLWGKTIIIKLFLLKGLCHG